MDKGVVIGKRITLRTLVLPYTRSYTLEQTVSLSFNIMIFKKGQSDVEK